MDLTGLIVFSVLIVSGVLLLVGVLFLVVSAGEPRGKATKDPIASIRHIGQETRRRMDRICDDYISRELHLLTNERARLVLSAEQLPRPTIGVSCLNETCPDYNQPQNRQLGSNLIKYGKTSVGNQRYRCKTCGKTFTRRNNNG